ncbi:putative alpha-glucosidase [Helianthus annuus]|nr:putative alpha-glucosidase [Helianthus annuus]
MRLITVILLLLSVHQKTVANTEKQPEPIGYGYSIRSVALDSLGKSLAADLQLNKKSSLFGPDIDELRLVARYFFFISLNVYIFLHSSVYILFFLLLLFSFWF